MNINLRLLYLYLFSFVGLLIVVIGSIQIVNLGLKMTVFKDSDKYEFSVPVSPDEKGVPQESVADMTARQEREVSRQRQRELANSLSMIVIGAPLYLYHWSMIQKEGKRKES